MELQNETKVSIINAYKLLCAEVGESLKTDFDYSENQVRACYYMGLTLSDCADEETRTKLEPMIELLKELLGSIEVSVTVDEFE